MAGFTSRIFFGLAALGILLGTTVTADLYSNSFISPHSSQQPNIPKPSISTSAPSEISKDESPPPTEEQVPFIQPRTATVDDLTVFKNVEHNFDGNDLHYSGRSVHFIQPSKTVRSGEVRGAPQARSIPLPEPREIRPTATMMPSFATRLVPLAGKARQANPDIKDIITGIVKLLNGNVNVQANTAPAMGRPLRPLSTRINNRGPPRITDMPALPPDFDIPAPPLPPPPLGQMPPPVSTTRMPTPYPFDIPPQNTSPLRPFPPDQVLSPTSKRPGFYRPVTIPPWNRRRPGGNRRPIPPYKPAYADNVSITSDKPSEDVLNLDLGLQLQPTNQEEVSVNETVLDEDKNGTYVDDNVTTYGDVEQEEVMDEETMEFEKNKEKTPSKMDKHTKSSSVLPLEETTKSSSLEGSSELLTETTSVISSSPISTQANNSTLQTSVVEEKILQTSLLNATIATEILNETSTLKTNDSTPILESSIQEVLQTIKSELVDSISSSTPTEILPSISKPIVESSTQKVNQSSNEFPYHPYRPRPGIVLDDTEYKPGGIRRPIITRPPVGQIGEIFDITVSAIQGPGEASVGHGKPYVVPVDIEGVHLGQNNPEVITSPIGNEGFVSIDGKRTYLNLFGENEATAAASIVPTQSMKSEKVSGTGFAVVEVEKPHKNSIVKNPINVKTTPRRPLYSRPQPPVRIDTCIVGDDSTCDGSQHEICRTEAGVSACHCRPGHARRKHRDPCRKVVSVLVSLRVDRLYERRVVWVGELADRNSDSYQQLAYETERALESAMSMTPFSDEFMNAKVNSIYRGDRSQGNAGVFVNLTLQLEENSETARSTIRGDIQRHLLGVIQRRSHNVGNSAVWVESPAGAVSNLQDLDECSSPELHDCHIFATCINVFGGFKCECAEGYRDPWFDNKHRAGRHCEQCPVQHCNNRGECKYQNGQEVCICSGNYYGAQCELDGEVLGVAIGASIAAIIIIGLTLVCLVMWSRRWNREQKAAVGSPVFGYMATANSTVKAPPMAANPYHLTLEDRLRWAQIADVMAQANHYAPEPVTGPTRPSSAMFGYPNLSVMGTLQQHGTLPPVPLPRLNLPGQFGSRAAPIPGVRPLDNSSSSEEEDKADLLGRNFQVPRPKSRSNASIANQSGIYYDVDYEPNEIYKQGSGIPLSTYGARTAYYRN